MSRLVLTDRHSEFRRQRAILGPGTLEKALEVVGVDEGAHADSLSGSHARTIAAFCKYSEHVEQSQAAFYDRLVPEILPRFYKAMQKEDLRRIGRILEETGELPDDLPRISRVRRAQSSVPDVPAAPEALTAVERERFTRWWFEESGLSLDELHEIAVGLS